MRRLKNLHGRDAAAPAAAAKKLAETPSQPAVENDIISDVDNTLFPLVVLLMSILAPMDLIRRYQEERSSLDAEIDRVIAEITEKLGGNAC